MRPVRRTRAVVAVLVLLNLLLPISAVTAHAATGAGALVVPASVEKGQTLEIGYRTDRPAAKNWVGLYTEPGNGPVDQKYVGPSTAWQYAPLGEGRVQFDTRGLEPGRHVAYLLADDGYRWLAQPARFDVVSADPSRFVTRAFETRAARAGERFEQAVRGVVRPARPDLVFRKRGGPNWVSVSRDGVLTGTPSTMDSLRPTRVEVEVSDARGRVDAATVTIPVRAPWQPLVTDVKVMSFNLWHAGTQVRDHRTKQLRFLLEQNVDVVGFQETSSVAARNLAADLGWHHYQASASVGLISRYPITATYPPSADGKALKGAGVRIRLDERFQREIVVWSAHLNYTPYGPYDACFSKMSREEVLKREEQSGRPREIRDILGQMAPQLAQADRIPVFLVGDFNAPSHLDWTSATSAVHCGYSDIPWPTSEEVERAGLRDSFRVAHPAPAQEPGVTWSPVYPFHDGSSGAPEPQDRIDFVHYAGRIRVLDSRAVVVGTPKPVPHHADNEWTSDHRAVVTTFRLPVL
ncbi:endonuclease/exonuclease/phosphatase family protein [Streptoalloteichus hindustanus]|uniref:Exonuclease III n=1 Tax=Streptoalloteichus hindustanus TaxID=2017 RepID=A0A1M4ZAM2_STRHI|nr:endonuclease/exonuclease/phosphatase family protein [Streptoalloteichus hindustanus]SHF14857.1 Exonuclease III [Streptoalloteichus hindustanus]